jgi:hypothetical protein
VVGACFGPVLAFGPGAQRHGDRLASSAPQADRGPPGGIPSSPKTSAGRAEELAERYAEEDGYAWRGPDWLEWDSARRVRPAVDGCGTAVEVWLVAVALDELTRFALELEPLLRRARRGSPRCRERPGRCPVTVGTDAGRGVKPGGEHGHRFAHPAGRSPSCRA